MMMEMRVGILKEEEEEEGITMTTIVTTPVVNASYHGSTIEE